MKEFKVGDIIYTNNDYTWHDTKADGEYHHIKKGDPFIISKFSRYRYTENVEILLYQKNMWESFEVCMSKLHFYESFLSEKEVRKLKIEKINAASK